MSRSTLQQKVRRIDSLSRRNYSARESYHLGDELRAVDQRNAENTYDTITTTPSTLSVIGIKEGMNIFGVTAPAGPVTVTIPKLSSPKMLVLITDERDDIDQDVITVIPL